VGYIQLATRRGFRNSSAVGYLRPALDRPNLTVLPNAPVTRVLLEGRRASGVELKLGDTTRTVRARREVVLSAGPMGSPQLLELSGIGNRDILAKHGIDVAHHLPAVGENLRDHPNTRITYECTLPITINDVLRSPWRKFMEGVKFAFTRGGLLSISSATVQAHVRSDPEDPQPDMVLRLQPLSGKDRYARTPKLGLDPFPGFTIGITLLRPRSVGSLHIRSRDVLQHPMMDPRYLSHEADAQLFMDGIKLARKLSQQPSLKPFVVRETRPGPEVQDEGALFDYVRSTVQTAWHQVGTCRMGADAESVVDPQLRVRGIDGLRVVDSSIFPTIPAANTNIPSIATGEKGAELLLEAVRD
jgi:choline dehydrogenase